MSKVKSTDKVIVLPELLHKVDVALVHLANEFSAKSDIRYYLHGVHLRKGKDRGTVIEATCGHMCAIIHDDGGESSEKDVIIDRRIINLLPKRGTISVFSDSHIEFDNINASMKKHERINIIRIENALVDGKYPDIDRVIPKDTSPGLSHSGWNAHYVLKALQFFKKIERKKWSEILFFQGAQKDSPAIFSNKSKSVFVIVMGMRDDEQFFKIPSHLDAK